MGGFSSLDKNIPILVVDDFLTMRKIVRTGLKQMGFNNVSEAEDGAKALEKLKSQEIKLIISDWNMPNMSGLDLLKAVRSDEKLKTIPFLMVTAEGKKENVLEAAKAGVSNYIVKPFATDNLQEKLEAIYKNK